MSNNNNQLEKNIKTTSKHVLFNFCDHQHQQI